ncbi:MAG: hypothetical protein WC465_02670 [Patescibacteria group bacterium]
MTILSELQQLPTEVKDIIFSNDLVEKNQALADKFLLNQSQINLILDLENLLFLKKLSPLDLPTRLESMERASYYDLRAITLDIAQNILWPLQDYLQNVDRLILRLGGKVPRAQHLKSVTLQKRLFPSSASGTVKQFLSSFDDFKELRLTAKKITDNNGRLITPSVDNWLKDYNHFLGAGYHNSLQRAQYLAKGPNCVPLELGEKESLRNFLLSYDDDLGMQWENNEGMLKVQLPVSAPKSDKPVKVDLDKAVAELQQNIKKIEQIALPADFILSEAGNDLFKVRDILWQAVGTEDKEKALSCLKVLVEKKSLDSLIAEDNRFRSILKRFIGIRYGSGFNNWLEGNSDKLLARRLFLEMILADKLRWPEAEAATIAFYLTNLWPQSGQVVYLDATDGNLKWRIMQVMKDNQLAWRD